MAARWIEPEETVYEEVRCPAYWVKKSFVVDNLSTARLFVTSKGCYAAYINGNRVGDYVLAPGPGNYRKRLAIQKYEVGRYLVEGENTIEILLGDGWYRGASGASGYRNLYGKKLGVIAWISDGMKNLVETDATWEASFNTALYWNDITQGEKYNANRENERTWHKVKAPRVKGLHSLHLSYVIEPPITEHERFTGKMIVTPDGSRIIDFGQNITGYVEMEFIAKAGQHVKLTHGEMLDAMGNFTLANIQPRGHHRDGGIFQTVEYTCKEGYNKYKPTFALFGFRYVLLDTNITLAKAKFTAISVYSDMRVTAGFESDNVALNQLFNNAIWSMKGNFIGVPNRNSTRERGGRMADAGVFAHTGLYLMNCEAVYRKWLAECRNCAYINGTIRNNVPNNTEENMMGFLLSGSVGYGDACVVVPYEIYKKTGDVTVLRENYRMMSRWVRYLERRALRGLVLKGFDKNPYKQYCVTSGIDFGEWGEPNFDPKTDLDINGKSGLATTYFAKSAGLLAEISNILGKRFSADHWKTVSDGAKKAYKFKYAPGGKILSDKQRDYIRAIEGGFLTPEETATAAADLNDIVVKNEYRPNTGLLSSGSLCSVLADNGYADTAYKVLLNEYYPGWICQIKDGATTIWDNWDKKEPQNGCAKGAVCGWLIEGICGIHYSFDQIVIRPIPGTELSYARAYFDSPKGRIESGWEMNHDRIKYTIVIPEGCKAKLQIPGRLEEEVSGGRYEFEVLR